MSENTLFDLDEPGDPFNGAAHPSRPLTPAPVGGGPAGKRCAECKHRVAVVWHNRTYQKCGLMREHWTHGAGSDIRAAWSACRRFDEK